MKRSVAALAMLSMVVVAVVFGPQLVIASKHLSEADMALFEAVKSNRGSMIKKALDAGADINAVNEGGQTPLMHASLLGSAWAVRSLLKAGADAAIGEKDGYTPMHGAGFQGRAEVAQVLHEFGIEINDKHRDGFTPIQRACWGGEKRHADTVETMVKLGANVADLKICFESPNPISKDLAIKHLGDDVYQEHLKESNPTPEL